VQSWHVAFLISNLLNEINSPVEGLGGQVARQALSQALRVDHDNSLKKRNNLAEFSWLMALNGPFYT